MKRMIKRIALTCIALIGTVLLIGVIYQMVGAHLDKKRITPVGQLVEVSGRNMHVYAEGEGEVTVVLTSGWGTVQPYVDFYPLVQRLSPHVKVVVYDRFGYGFSDLTDRKRDIDTMVDEIHEALEKSGQHPPYVFVGHSLGSLEVIRYAQRYKEEVKGVLLLDGGTPEYYADSPSLTAVSHVQRLLVNTGMARLLSHSDLFMNFLNDERNQLRHVPENLRELDLTTTLTKANNKNVTDEMRQSRSNARKILRDREEGEGLRLKIPIVALTADYFDNKDPNWEESQKGWKDWSDDASQTTLPLTGHYIHHYVPDQAVIEILKLCES